VSDIIHISIGTPQHGWLPVIFRNKDISLDLHALNVLNDPIEQLYNVIINLKHEEERQVIWWLEPGAYILGFKRENQNVTLRISEKKDLNVESSEELVLTVITGNNKEIINPFFVALKDFVSKDFAENDWPYKLNKEQIKNEKFIIIL
jgi:hypothetical protein